MGKRNTQLVEAVDAVETARRFKPPLFVDIRYHRNVLAKEFNGNAFGELLGKERYRWMKSLGNEAIGQGTGGVKIADPSAAEELLDLALSRARQKQRLLFFCACASPQRNGALFCHRYTVAGLLLESGVRGRTKLSSWIA